MERGSAPPDRPDPERPTGPGPETPPGPQAPAPGPQAPPGYAPPAPDRAPSYGGPVPPGGWQQPIARPESGWAGRPLAGWGIRLGAWLIDWLILLVPVALLIVLVVVVALSSDVGAILTGILSTLAYVVVALFYAPVLMARGGERNGQTWGKQAVGIRVVRDNGVPIDMGFGFLREFVVKNLLFWFVGGFFAYIPTLVNYLWPLWDDQNRCLHDMIVSSHVIRG
jgi:uncharacterized RDD family membrane protein YckC